MIDVQKNLAITDNAGKESMLIHISQFWDNSERVINTFKNFNFINITTEKSGIYPQFTLFYDSIDFTNGYESHKYKIEKADIHHIARLMLSLIDKVDLPPSQRMSIKSCLKM